MRARDIAKVIVLLMLAAWCVMGQEGPPGFTPAGLAPATFNARAPNEANWLALTRTRENGSQRVFWLADLAGLAAAESFDYWTTAGFVCRAPGPFACAHAGHETNPLLGREPGDGRLVAYGAGEWLAFAAVTRYTERSRHAWVRWAGRAAIAYQVGDHVRLGLRNRQWDR